MSTAGIGEKIRKWDEVNGAAEERNEPGTTPQDHMDGPFLQTGNSSYLKTAEELMEDDYFSIDGIINNGKRDDIDGEQEKNRESVMEKIREHEEKQRSMQPVAPPVITAPAHEKDHLCPDRSLC